MGSIQNSALALLFTAGLAHPSVATPNLANSTILVGMWKNEVNPSVFHVQYQGTKSGRTEVHILSPKSNYTTYSLHAVTNLGLTNSNTEYLAEDWDGDGISDLWAIKKSLTDSKSTEVHILSGASDYKEFIYHDSTILEESGDNFKFITKSNLSKNGFIKPDLVAIKLFGSKTTELHILSGVGNFKKFFMQSETALHPTTREWTFAFQKQPGLDQPELICISPANGGELHALGGKSYDRFTGHEIVSRENGASISKFAISKEAKEAVVACTAAALSIGAAAVAPVVTLFTYGQMLLLSAVCSWKSYEYFSMKYAEENSGSGGTSGANRANDMRGSNQSGVRGRVENGGATIIRR
ncbi:hypothetical protein [Dyadobacter psychrotolerans]|uniref:VCBS repeat-containing protein n=1 Tax=Dyadobacter psychrotolerans TaxID=2541721 RepID=A0A4R5DR56_9BACT|nr:hypothetical protein [Dyadobacter psychrotolerans]TDE16167.1 hypothetical protein E0F88_07895 [Dyadobacter psychrotolerans]